MYNKPASKNDRGLWAVAFILGYFIFEAFYVSAISQGAGLDDAELISNISFFRFGYGGSQPPLYTWISYFACQLFGLHFWLLQIIKDMLLASTFLAVYAALRMLGTTRLTAASAMLGIFLLPQIGWESQRALTHSIMGTAGSAWSFAAFIFFVRRRSLLSAVIMGLAFACALLGKFNGGLFLVALLIGGLCMPMMRHYFKSLYFYIGLIVMAGAIAPVVGFIVMHPQALSDRTSKLAIAESGNFILDRLTGLFDFAFAGLSFSAVALVTALVGFIHFRLWKRERSNENAEAFHFVGSVLLSGILLVAILVAIMGITNVKDRWLQPVLFLVPAYLVLVLSRFELSTRIVKYYGFIGMVAALIVPVVLYINIASNWRNEPPIQLLDYAPLDKALKAQGDYKMILADRPTIAGNLRLRNPDIKTVHEETPDASTKLQLPLVIMWENSETIPDKLAKIAHDGGIRLPNYPILGKFPVHEVELGYEGMSNFKRHIYYIYVGRF